ncbi:hypothetical protein F2Q69_00031330 [Brassica cretica]|uniref:Uncharacterized protein n=1 Tax=Brassica cretica TaxID=69181 RepID=A0A8S9SAJ9_BRACR|nr:hypothetical protein F2Q69_00031330 [Brassica cretica]
MRVNQEEKEFSDWLLQVGEGHPHLESGYECDNHHEQMIAVDKSLIRIYSPEHISQTMAQSNEEELTRSLYPAIPCYFFLMVHTSSPVIQMT